MKRLSNAYQMLSATAVLKFLKFLVSRFIRAASLAAAATRGDADAGCSGSFVLDGLAAAFTLSPELHFLLSCFSSSCHCPALSYEVGPYAVGRYAFVKRYSPWRVWVTYRSTPFPWKTEWRCEYCVQTVLSLWVMAILSLRGVDGLRSRVVPSVNPLVSPLADVLIATACGRPIGGSICGALI